MQPMLRPRVRRDWAAMANLQSRSGPLRPADPSRPRADFLRRDTRATRSTPKFWGRLKPWKSPAVCTEIRERVVIGFAAHADERLPGERGASNRAVEAGHHEIS